MGIPESSLRDLPVLSLLDASRALLYCVIAASALYLMQHYFWFPFAASWRLLIFGSALALMLWAQPKLVLSVPLLLWVLGLSVVLAGVHTYILFGSQLAVTSTSRFANVMAIAPLAAVLLTTHNHIQRVFGIYALVFCFALLSMLYQYFGGSIPAIVGNYVAIRADLLRYMTVVGEPNVGGMIAVLGFVIAVTIPRRRITAVSFAGLAVAFVIMSLSKAANLGLILVCAGLLLSASPTGRLETLIRIVAAGAVGLLVLFLIGAEDYLIASIRAVLGQISGEPSVVQDFARRQVAHLGIETPAPGGLASSEVETGSGPDPTNPLFSSVFRFLFGASFGVAGSAAQQFFGLGKDVMLPHNSYLEMYLTGGIAMLGCAAALMFFAFRSLVIDVRRYGRSQDQCVLVCLAILSCWMLVYPVIYEPATGALFWTMIGYGNRAFRSDGAPRKEDIESPVY